MNFLVWWNPTTWLSDVSSSIVGSIVAGLRTFLYWVGTALFDLIIKLYNLFEALCHGRLLDSEIMSKLTTRVGLVLGLIMLFYVAVSFIQSLVNPEDLTNEKKGPVGVIKKVIIVIILLGTAPFLFDTLFQIQSAVVKNHVVSKILLPVNINTENFGNALAAETFIAFYDVDPRMKGSDNEDVQTCQSVVWTLKDRIYKNGDFALGNDCLNEFVNLEDVDGEAYGDVEANIIKFDWLIMLGVGAFLVYFFVSYCISVGMRMFQIAILEIISPMAFISYLSSKDDSLFSRWRKTYFSTYIDVFLRIAIINFAVFLIAAIMDVDDTSFSTFWTTVQGGNRVDDNLIMLAMIVALLAFAKKAPDLIKKLFPGGDSNLGLGGLHVKDIMGGKAILGVGKKAAAVATFGTAGVVANGLTSAWARASDFHELRKDRKWWSAGLAGLGGFGSGAWHSFKGSFKKGNPLENFRKGISEQRTVDNQYRELIAAGGSRHGQMASSVADLFGSSRGTRDEFKIQSAKKVEEPLKKIFETAENTVAYKELMQQKLAAYNQGNNALADNLQKQADALRDKFVEESLRGRIQGLNSLSYSYQNSAGITVNASSGVSSGDKVKGNTIRTEYANARVEVNQLKPSIIDTNGNVVGTYSLGDASTVSAATLNATLKSAQNTQANVAGTSGYRAGQANRPHNNNNSNNK